MRLNNGDVLLHWPLDLHILTAGYYYKGGGLHRAIDLRCNGNGSVVKPVYAAEDGTVETAYQWNGTVTNGDTNSYGNMVKIRHADYNGKALQTLYAHLSSFCVAAGQKVTEGQLIGYTGYTGNVSPAGIEGAHLHFEVRRGGSDRRNPLCWLDGDFVTTDSEVYTFGAGEHSVERPAAVPDFLKRGVDVSKYQLGADIETMCGDPKCEFAMIRAVSTNNTGIYIDPCFEDFYKRFTEKDKPVGAYYYTYAADRETVKAEVDKLLHALDGKQFAYPIAIDVEENKLKVLSTAELTALVLYAAELIRAAGYYPMVYSYRYFENTELDMAALAAAGLDNWIADYTGTEPTIAHTMFQFTSKGAVAGYAGNVDLNLCYKDYPEIIKAEGVNGFAGGCATDTNAGDKTEPDVEAGKLYEVQAGPMSAGDVAAVFAATSAECERLGISCALKEVQ